MLKSNYIKNLKGVHFVEGVKSRVSLTDRNWGEKFRFICSIYRIMNVTVYVGHCNNTLIVVVVIVVIVVVIMR